VLGKVPSSSVSDVGGRDFDIGGGCLDVSMTCCSRESSLLVTGEASLTVAYSRLRLDIRL
jgi:hypothetical protein